MSLNITCANCGPRPHTEFTFCGELRPLDDGDRAGDFARVYLRVNASGPQAERWFHLFGCRRWSTITRDTVTNRIET
jgi:sarcosine oxidase subunit delta